METLTARGKRSRGIDSLRMLSMLMVVVLHLLGQGGVLTSAPALSLRYLAAWLLECAAYCAVNCYALISGYVGYGGRMRYSRLAELWLQVVFWTLSITACFALLRPETVNPFTWRSALLPILTGQYWYLTAYFGLFFLTPLLNAGVEHLSRGSLAALLGAVFLFFSLIPRLFAFSETVDPFKLDSGYSVLWLALLYIAGACLRKYDVPAQIRRPAAAMGFAGAVLLTWGSKTAIELLNRQGVLQNRNSYLLVDYTSPTVVLAAVCLLVFFARTEYPAWAERAVALLSPAALGVYVVHAQPLLWGYVLKGAAAPFALNSTPVLVGKVLLTALLIYLVCTGAELVRLALFRLLGVGALCRRAEESCRARLARGQEGR